MMSDSFPRKLSSLYIIVASLWILFSDSAVAIVFAEEVTNLRIFSMLKGLGFVFITGFMLYSLIKNEIHKRKAIELSLEEESSQHSLARKQFSQKERIYKIIIDSMNDIVFTMDMTGHYIGLYGSWDVTLDIPPELLIGKTAIEAIGEVDGRIHQDANDRALKGEKIVYEWSINDQIIQTQLSPLYDETGKIQGIVGVGRDVTSLKRAEELEAQAHLLEAELAQERETLGKQMNILSLVSHEFRTPLSIIRSSNSLIEHYRARMSDEQINNHIQQIDEQVLVMTELMDDVLTVEKLRRTLFLSNPTAVNLIELAQTVIQQVKAAYKEKQQTIQLEASGAFENIVLDSRLTRSILTNLLTNATKYSPQRSTIICKLDAQPEQIILQITDQGIGIPEADQKQLFEPFYRAQNATEIKGTGLGLVIVKQSVEAQQGKINIKTAENQGTTFTITLPRRL